MLRKKINKILIFTIFLIFYFTTFSISDSTIKGNIYDFSYEELEGVKVTINTQPEQIIISKDSSYSFFVNKGNYTINAIYQDINLGDLIATENITIISDGIYHIDLILFPTFNDTNLVNNFIDFDIDYNLERANNSDSIQISTTVILIIFLSLILIILVLFFILKKLKPKKIIKKKIKKAEISNSSDIDYSNQILYLLTKNNGRLSQREIRKSINLSEAKISLILRDLESEEKIKKIKSGRGNIIVLSKV